MIKQITHKQKTLLALQIIAGTVEAHGQWEYFLSYEKPKRDYPGEDREEYWNDVNGKVKDAACEHVADLLNSCHVHGMGLV